MLLANLVATQSCFFQHGSVSKITRYTHRTKIIIRLTARKDELFIMKKVREILYVFLLCVPFSIMIYITALIGILIYKLYKMTKVNDIKVTDPETVSNEFSAVIRRIDIENAKQILRESGYFVDNLWCVEDVQTNYYCTEEEAQQVLDGALQNEATMEQIWFAIKEHAGMMNLKNK